MSAPRITAREPAASWLRRQFEFENCHECRRGARSHEAISFLGNWFARCKPVARRVRTPSARA